MDLNGDPKDGCETKLAACEGETRCSEFADCFELGIFSLKIDKFSKNIKNHMTI